jgi:hypothetical protein
MPLNPTYQVFTQTATDDNAFNLVSIDIWVLEVDIQIKTNNAYIGDSNNQTFEVLANDVYTIKGPINIREIYVKNKTAGQNTNVTIAGVSLSEYQKKMQGIG